MDGYCVSSMVMDGYCVLSMGYCVLSIVMDGIINGNKWHGWLLSDSNGYE